jgi:hypothetical protein
MLAEAFDEAVQKQIGSGNAARLFALDGMLGAGGGAG